MKIKLLEILFCILFIAFILGLFILAELIISVINVNTVMLTLYAVLGLCFIYLIRN